ncbi:FHA domain-containing protein [Anatilimnocola floriformis]|uniref:FHA domain-containing protein n=1 Tax=Anatilimnocola floriformis TaxID=2948575 RepID=UPI0020C38A65|nr:FHA domain-containing protein [Anatilimnocola floriformis]
MRAFLQVIKGPGLGRKITLREGQLMYVGRTTADINFPENPEMSSVHFSIQWLGNECQFKDLNSANGSFRNGERVTDSLVYNGDEIRAGQAIFRVVMGEEGELSNPAMPEYAKPAVQPTWSTTKHEAPPPSGGTSGRIPAQQPPQQNTPQSTFQPSSPPPAQTPPPAPAPHAHAHPSAPIAVNAGMPSAEGSVGLLIATATDVVQIAPVDDDTKKLAKPDWNTPQFVESLAGQEKFLDAIRVLAFAMGKLTVIEWAHRCVNIGCGEGLSKIDANALDLVQRWLGDRSEGLRREIYAASQAADHGTAASWVAMAAFWSEGSMGPPPPAPPLAPGPTQCAHAATGAILLAAVAKQPEKAPDKYREFLRVGLEMVKG